MNNQLILISKPERLLLLKNALQAGGHWFESSIAHQIISHLQIFVSGFSLFQQSNQQTI
jgi:hypothetical protein